MLQLTGLAEHQLVEVDRRQRRRRRRSPRPWRGRGAPRRGPADDPARSALGHEPRGLQQDRRAPSRAAPAPRRSACAAHGSRRRRTAAPGARHGSRRPSSSFSVSANRSSSSPVPGLFDAPAEIAFADGVNRLAHRVDRPQGSADHDPDQHAEQHAARPRPSPSTGAPASRAPRTRSRRTRHHQGQRRVRRHRLRQHAQVTQRGRVLCTVNATVSRPLLRSGERAATPRGRARTAHPTVRRDELHVQVRRSLRPWADRPHASSTGR